MICLFNKTSAKNGYSYTPANQTHKPKRLARYIAVRSRQLLMKSRRMIDIVKEIRDYFSSQDAFQLRYDLAKNRHLVKGIIPQEHWIPGQTIWFKSDNNGLIWSNCFKIDLIKDIDGNEIYEFENDFTTIGRLGYGYENREYEVVAEFALTYLVYKYPGSTLIQADHSFLLDKNQKIERDFFRLIEKNTRFRYKSKNE